MTSMLDPDIRAMREAESEAAAAAVLLSAPFATLLRYRRFFASHCIRTGFAAGTAYLDALGETLHKQRHRGHVNEILHNRARCDLIQIVEVAARPADARREP